MSEANVEIVKRATNQLNLLVGGSDPLPVLREVCDPDVEWDFSRRGIDPEVYQGYEGWLRFTEQFRDAWQEFRFDAEEIIDAGESVVLFGHNTGLAKSGIKLSRRASQVWTF